MKKCTFNLETINSDIYQVIIITEQVELYHYNTVEFYQLLKSVHGSLYERYKETVELTAQYCMEANNEIFSLYSAQPS